MEISNVNIVEYKIEPKISVIIPSYNAASFLNDTLDSVLSQHDSRLEVWVINDGSTDGTDELLAARRHNVNSLRIDNSGGPSLPRNIGIKFSRAPFISFFDADDVMLPGKLNYSVDVLQRYPSCGFVCTDFCGIDLNGNIFVNSWLREYNSFRESLISTNDENIFLLKSNNAYHHLLRINFVGTSSVICRREVINKVGNFDENLSNAEDIDLWRRIAFYGVDFLFINLVMHCYRFTPNSISSKGDKLYKNMIKGLEKQLKFSIESEDRKFLINRISELYIEYGYLLRKKACYAGARYAYFQSLYYKKKLNAYMGLFLSYIKI